MNRTVEERGVDRVVGELRRAVPDVVDFLNDADGIIASANRNLEEWVRHAKAANLSFLALRQDIELLDDLAKRGRVEWRAISDEVERGVEDMTVLYPQLGFTVIKAFPGGGKVS